MKNFYVIMSLLLVLFASNMYAVCIKIPCSPTAANSPEESAENKLKSSFEEVEDELKNVKKEYQKLLDKLKESSSKLDKSIEISKNKLLRENEILFLLTQHNELQGIENNRRTKE